MRFVWSELEKNTRDDEKSRHKHTHRGEKEPRGRYVRWENSSWKLSEQKKGYNVNVYGMHCVIATDDAHDTIRYDSLRQYCIINTDGRKRKSCFY